MAKLKTARPVKAAVMLFLATSVWGGSFLAMKALGLKQAQLVPRAGTWFFTSVSLLMRFSVSALLIGLWAGRRLGQMTRLEIWQGLGLGSFGGIGILLQTDGVQHTAASTSAFLTQCYCIFIPVTLAIHRRKWPGIALSLCCAMVLSGMAILSNIDFMQLRMGRGEWESILGSLLFTGQILWLERPLYHGNRTEPVTFVMFVVIALLTLPVLLMTGTTPREWIEVWATWPAIWLIGFLTLCCTLATYTLMNYWQPHLPATQAGLIYCCEPLFTSLFALWIPNLLSTAFQVDYPNEAINTRLLIGGGLITAANLIALRNIPMPPAPLPAAEVTEQIQS
jgi:drug/metabolite transporter (DMT)-like permease